MTPLMLRPADGRRVRKPDGSLLADSGETVTPGPYWQRRLKDGDVVPTAPVAPVAPVAPTAPAEPETASRRPAKKDAE